MRRKTYILLLLLSTTMLWVNSSCKKSSRERMRDDEKADRANYIEENNISGDSKTSSGLYYIEVLEGEGDKTIGERLLENENISIISVWYTGYLLDGTIFDSNENEGRFEPFSLSPTGSGVIQGWYEGIFEMKKGGKAQLIIPSNLAYGASGSASSSGVILPYSTLVFDIEIHDIITAD